MISSSSFGISQITLQFDLNRNIDARGAGRAGRDQRRRLDAAANLPYPPIYSKVNPADAPIVTLALTSPTISLRAALATSSDTLLAQRLSEVVRRRQGHRAGRAQAGGPHPGRPGAARQLRHRRSRTCAPSIVAANVAGPAGALDGAHQSYTIAANQQITAAEAYRNIVVAYRNNAPVLLKDVADDRRRAREQQGRRLVQRPSRGRGRHPAPARRQRGRDRRSASSASCRGCSAPSRPAPSSPWCTTPPPPSAPRSATCSSRWC